MTPVRALVADDEAPARARITALLAARPGYRIVAETESGPATLEAVTRARPDLVFLDVQMPGLSGLDVWRRLPRAGRPVVIFTTAFDRYALDAFEARAIDYLLKPFTDERFEEALDRAARQLRGVGGGAGPPFLERFAVRAGERVTIVPAAEVDWIEAARDYARLHVGPAVHPIRTTMQTLEARLDPSRFLRIHRSAIVQLSRVVGLEPYSRNEDVVILRTGARIVGGRRYRTATRERLGL